MACVCVQCRVNGETLGLRELPASREAIHHAYRRAAMAWHPDRFANEPSRIHEAEERFKVAQAAYRELTEHNPEDDEPPPDRTAQKASAETWTPQSTRTEVDPAHASLWYHQAPGWFVASHFPLQAEYVARQHLGLYDYPIAILDLLGDGSFARFFLLASHGVIVKDGSGKVSLLRYHDMGKIELLDREQEGTVGLWEKIAEGITGVKQKLSLEIFRRDGSHFCSVAGQASDFIKPAIYQFLASRKLRYNK